MPNHFHLLVETPGANLQQFMHKLETAYTVYFNLRHQRVGHLMQGRYKAQPVQGDDYLLKLSRYIHLNPVCGRALQDAPLSERVTALRTYAWSSYREYVGLEPPTGLVETGPLLRLVGGSGGDPARDYGQYVEAGLARSDDEFKSLLKSSDWAVGDEDFCARMDALHRVQRERVGCQEDVAFRRNRAARSVEEVLSKVAEAFGLSREDLGRRRYGCRVRAVAARMLWRQSGLTQREIAKVLGMGTGAAVCQQLRALESALEHNPDLRERELQIQRELSIT